MDVRNVHVPLTAANVAVNAKRKAASPFQPKKAAPQFPGVARSAPGGGGYGVPPVAALGPSAASLLGGDADDDDFPVGYTPFDQPGGIPMPEPDEENPLDRITGIAERKAGLTIQSWISGQSPELVYKWAIESRGQ